LGTEACRRAFSEAVALINDKCGSVLSSSNPGEKKGFCDLLSDTIEEKEEIVDKYSELIKKVDEIPDKAVREEIKVVLDNFAFTEEGHRRVLIGLKERRCGR